MQVGEGLMANNFDWSQYRLDPEQSTIKNIPEVLTESAKGLGRVAGKGIVSYLAAPSKLIGGGLEYLSKIYPEDTGLRGAPRKGLESSGKFISETGKGGQEYLKGLIEDSLGKSYGSGEEAITGFTEVAADILGRGPVKAMIGPALIGGAFAQTAKLLGFSEETQKMAELIGITTPDIKKAASALKSVEKIKEKSGLVLPRIIDKTKGGWKFVKGKVFPKEKEKVYEEVSNQAEKLINSMKHSEFPLSVEIKKGIDVEARSNIDLRKVNKLASKMDHRIESDFISDYLNNVEEKIRSGAPVPSKEQEEILGLVSKYKEKYDRFTSKRFYTPSEYVKQYRNINSDSRVLYERAWIEGKKGSVRKFYGELNNEFEKTIEIGTPKSFSNLFKESNAKYSELQKLNSFESILEKVTSDGVIDAKKFNNIFKSPEKSKLLRKQVGSESFEQMRLISKDLSKVKDKLGLIDEMGGLSMVKSLAVGGLLKKMKLGPIGIPIQAGKTVADLSYGYFLLNPKGQRDYRNFLKAVESGNKKAIERYLKTMDKHALEEEQKNQ